MKHMTARQILDALVQDDRILEISGQIRFYLGKIRPGVWYSKRPQRFLPFASLPDFLAAVEETVYQNVDTHDHAADWRNRFQKSYKAFYGCDIELPRWHEVKARYVLS